MTYEKETGPHGQEAGNSRESTTESQHTGKSFPNVGDTFTGVTGDGTQWRGTITHVNRGEAHCRLHRWIVEALGLQDRAFTDRITAENYLLSIEPRRRPTIWKDGLLGTIPAPQEGEQ